MSDNRTKYQALLEQLHQNYDPDLERDLVQAARMASVTSADLDNNALVYRKKHGLFAPEMFPLNLAELVRKNRVNLLKPPWLPRLR